MKNTGRFCLRAVVAVVLLCSPSVSSPQQGPSDPLPDDLKIKIICGEGAINNLRSRLAREPIVEVRDRNNRPLALAVVLFELPTTGPGGAFADGSNVFRIFTNVKGRAIAQGFRPNGVGGAFKINVTASFERQIGTAVIPQTNIGAAATSVVGAAPSAAPETAAAPVAAAAPEAAAAPAAAAPAAAAAAPVAAAASVSATAVGVSGALIGAAVGGGAAAGAIGAKAATGGDTSSPPTPPAGTIGTPGAPVIGPAAVVGKTSSPYRSLARLNGSTASASNPIGGATAKALPVNTAAEPKQSSSTSRLSGARTGIIASVVAGAAVGTWWYFKHRHDRQVVLSPDEIRFRGAVVGQSAYAVIALYNRSKTDVVVTSIGEPELFRITATQSMPVTVRPGRSAFFHVTFSPKSVGKAKESITLTVSGGSRTWLKRLIFDGEGALPLKAVAGHPLVPAKGSSVRESMSFRASFP